MKKYIFFASAVVALAACNSNEEFEQIGNCEIKLSSTLLVQTRAAQDIQSTAFDSGAEVAVFINEDSSSPSTSYTQPLQYNVEDDGSLTTMNPQYFPQNGNGVNIFAVYPFEAGQNVEVTETAATFSVQSDQSSKDNYKASDLMVGEPTSKPVYRTTSNVTLQFKHCLSKININIKVGDGVDANDLDGARVTIYTKTNDATFDVQSGVITAVGSQGQAASPFVTVGDLTASGNGFEGMSAIIIPQDISAGSHFISIATNNQTTYRYNLPNTVNLISFEPGKAYTYNLTVRKSGLTLDNTNITDWDDGGSVDGDAFQS